MYTIQLGLTPAFLPLLSFLPSFLFCLLPAHALHLKPKEISSFDHADFPTVSRRLHLYTLFSDNRAVLYFYRPLCIGFTVHLIQFSKFHQTRRFSAMCVKDKQAERPNLVQQKLMVRANDDNCRTVIRPNSHNTSANAQKVCNNEKAWTVDETAT